MPEQSGDYFYEPEGVEVEEDDEGIEGLAVERDDIPERPFGDAVEPATGAKYNDAENPDNDFEGAVKDVNVKADDAKEIRDNIEDAVSVLEDVNAEAYDAEEIHDNIEDAVSVPEDDGSDDVNNLQMVVYDPAVLATANSAKTGEEQNGNYPQLHRRSHFGAFRPRVKGEPKHSAVEADNADKGDLFYDPVVADFGDADLGVFTNQNIDDLVLYLRKFITANTNVFDSLVYLLTIQHVFRLWD
jgi:hypothetical protein